jgi:hypothetical protein
MRSAARTFRRTSRRGWSCIRNANAFVRRRRSFVAVGIFVTVCFFVIVELLPEVLALSTEEKEILAELLLNQVVLEQDKDPALVDLIARRLNDHNANLASGGTWEELRDRLLKR